MNVTMKMRSSAFVSAILFMSIGVSAVAQAASAGGSCKTAGRTVVASGVNLRCTQTKTGLKWRVVAPPAKSSEPSATTTPVVAAPIVPFVSVEPTLLRQPSVISVNSNVVGTVYIAEVSVQVAKVSDIENAGRYLWVSAPITKVGVNEINVDIDAVINGNYRVYVANDKGVLSAASLNMVVVSMPRIYDRVAAQEDGTVRFTHQDHRPSRGIGMDLETLLPGKLSLERSETDPLVPVESHHPPHARRAKGAVAIEEEDPAHRSP